MKISIIRTPDALVGNLNQPYEVVPVYKKNNFIIKVLRKLFYKKAFIQPFINNSKLKNLDSDVIIVFDSVSIEFLKWFQKYNKGKRLILWYWNPVALTINPDLVPSGYEKWSYSISDCEKYNLKYNTQFCFERYKDYASDVEPLYDVFFIGRDKGREVILNKYKTVLSEVGLTSNFIVIQNSKQFVPYDKVIELTQKSKCIFDLCAFDDTGMSLRALEALYMGKKVITNNYTYLKEPFYKEENVFIIGKDDLSTISEFINSPYVQVDEEIKKYYLFDNWISRFLEK